MPYIFAWLVRLLLTINLLFHHTFALRVGQLGVRINYKLAAHEPRRSVFGSVVTIKGLQTWSDGQIVDLAMVAHDEMQRAHASIDFTMYSQGTPAKIPGGTTTLVVGNTAYISTSVGGESYFYLPNGNTKGSRFTEYRPGTQCGAVVEALQKCQEASWDQSGHRTGASCGEPMAALSFCLSSSRQLITDGKIVTIIGKTSPKIIAPCGRPGGSREYAGEWGCDKFTKVLGLQVIPEDTPRYPAVEVPSEHIRIEYTVYP